MIEPALHEQRQWFALYRHCYIWEFYQMEVRAFGDNWRQLKDDPVALAKIRLADATVSCAGDKCFQGVIHSIDPTSKSLILARIESNKVKDMILCIGSAVREVVASENSSKHARLVDQIFAPAKALTATEEKERRERLIAHLRTRSLPCTEDGKIIRIATWAHIEPPYTKKELFCSNEIIQERVSAILDELV
ncbi:uncharacterized protein LOC100901671 [Galendromus occidentalis]|uniref:Uncharacterized protein LOC100901671 n=1 Tax=Galendromus occidentalis TaxID=34638 RepID=A0AAJ6VVV6_9ACAR|nr:uncharacterized protein LOC100901671 [Galendromus occidentalis]